MKKRIVGIIALAVLTVGVLAGCETQASRVEYNLTQEADNFNIVRQLTVINCLQGDVFVSDDRKNVYYCRCRR